MASPLIRTLGYHCRQKFGHTVGKIPLDLGEPCPNRRLGGCIFCRPASFTPFCLQPGDAIAEQLAAGKRFLLRGRFKKYFAYFQQETCTAVPQERFLQVVRSLLLETDCVGLILSTRPDCVADTLLKPLADLVEMSGKECLFELGLQSVHAESLKLLNRNHSFANFHDAVLRIQGAGCFDLGAHLLFGIPGESQADMLSSLQTVCDLGVGHLKLHHLQVIRDTPLATFLKEGRVHPFTKDEYFAFLLGALPIIPAGVTLHRLWATAHPDLLLAPRWGRLASDLSAELHKMMAARGIRQGQLATRTSA